MGVKRNIKKNQDSSVLLESLFYEFISEKKARNLSPATIFSYEKSFERFNKFLGERNTTEEITQKTYYAYIEDLKEDSGNGVMKITSVNHYLRDVRAFLNWCMERDSIAYFKMPLQKEQETVKETYTEEECLLLLDKPHKKAGFAEWRTWAMVAWVLGTGSRAETICSIKMGDINLFKSEARIGHTKNKKAQVLNITRELNIVLNQYIRDWRSEASNEEYLFCSISGEKLTTNAQRHAFRDYCHNRGIEKTSIHALRHTFAKQFILNTGDVFRLQKILGHSTLEMTRRYVNMFDDEVKEGLEQFTPLDRLKKTQQRKHVVKHATSRR